MIRCLSLPPPPFCQREALRYAGVQSADQDMAALLDSVYHQAAPALSYRVCFGEFPLCIRGNICDLGFAKTESAALARHLMGCESILVMGATIGISLDRLILRWGRLSPARALMLQALGTERIESTCDAFCEKMEGDLSPRGLHLTPRFSPGYGDLPLSLQRDLFSALAPENKIGLTLNSSLIMSPSKSVTALMGLTREKPNPIPNPCRSCAAGDCAYRRSQ